MTLDEFQKVDNAARLAKPKLFLLSSPDTRATDEQIVQVERQMGIVLPPSYRTYLQGYGGGNFGLVTVFSADSESDWFLPRKLAESKRYLPPDLLPFSDDFAGGNYVFKVVAGQAEEPVYYWNEDGGLQPTAFADVLEFVARHAYEPA